MYLFIKPFQLVTFFMIILAGSSCQEKKTIAQIPPGAPPKLAVVIIVDQMRADHLTRFAGVYKDGLARFYNEGIIFNDAHQDHSYTVTGAGHATISSGCYPAKNGVVGNNWYERSVGREIYCVEDTTSPLLDYPDLPVDKGRSPVTLQVPALGDWLKAANPESKVISVARKDRGAVLMGGHKPDGAYWYDANTGNLQTSRYYGDDLPDWVKAFNHSRRVDRYYEDGWQKFTKDESIYFLAREDSFFAEKNPERAFFPHSLKTKSGKPDKRYYNALQTTPFGDELVIDFAKEALIQENLGQDDVPDILFIGCSAADAIGHDFGPLSQESMDYFLYLDKYIGDLFTFLDEKVGAGNYLTVLSSDHGVIPLPEELQRRGYPAKRILSKETNKKIEEIMIAVGGELGIEASYFIAKSGFGVVLDYDVAAKFGVDQKTLNNRLKKAFSELEAIEDVYEKDDLFATWEKDEYIPLFRQNYHPERSADLIFRVKENVLVGGKAGTSHGSPYRYDTHVPIVFAGMNITPASYDERVRTIDIAPTIAAILGIAPPADIDGRKLLQ